MKLRMFFVVASVFLGIVNTRLYGQMFIESSYMLPSNYRDDTDTETGGSGDFKDIRWGLQAPFYMKRNELNQPTVWAVGFQGAYAAMNNNDLTTDLCISQLLNADLGITYIRPLGKNWSLTASLTGGIHTGLSEFNIESIIIQGGTLFMWHILPNLNLGLGAVVNNIIGYPMIFPSFYFNWKVGKRFKAEILVQDSSFMVSAGMRIHEVLALRLIAHTKNMNAVVERNDETKIFNQQFTIVGLQPEFYINKMVSIPITAGVSLRRNVFFQDRTLAAFYQLWTKSPGFATAFSVSIGLKFFFNEE